VVSVIVKNPKKSILKVLGGYPEGMLIIEIAREVGMDRLTISKYIHELIGEDKIYQRKLGRVRLCILKR
jgi:DNA-binding IclR family transcriptional regulator